MKPPLYNSREQEVLERPDGYRLHVYVGASKRQESPDIWNAEEAYNLIEEIESKFPTYRVLVYASRTFLVGTEHEERLAHVRKSDLLPLVIKQ